MAAAQQRDAQRASRKKPPRQRAEQQQQAQRIELSQSIRAVYRRLAAPCTPTANPTRPSAPARPR
jgi:hypothetical protein